MVKKLVWIIIIMIALQIWGNMDYQIRYLQKEVDRYIEQVIELNEKLYILSDGKDVVITGYNPVEWQTDNTPYITASNDSIVDYGIAVSRDMLKRWGGSFNYNDTVLVVIPFVIRDTMHSRWKDAVDIVFDDYWEALSFGRRNGKIIKK